MTNTRTGDVWSYAGKADGERVDHRSTWQPDRSIVPLEIDPEDAFADFGDVICRSVQVRLNGRGEDLPVIGRE